MFVATRFGEDAGENAPGILKSALMLVAKRHEPTQCSKPLPFEREVTVDVNIPLPSTTVMDGAMFLACPPGSTYEMVKLSEVSSDSFRPSFLNARQPPVAIRPADWDEEEDGEWRPAFASAPKDQSADDSVAFSDPVAEQARVQAELETHEPADTVAFLAHCEEKLAAGAAPGCCSELMMEALRSKVAIDQVATPREDANISELVERPQRIVVDAVDGASSVAPAVASK